MPFSTSLPWRCSPPALALKLTCEGQQMNLLHMATCMPRVLESACKPLKLFLRSLQPLVPVDVSSTGFKARCFRDLSIKCRSPEAGVSVLVTTVFLRKKLQEQAALLGLRPVVKLDLSLSYLPPRWFFSYVLM